MLDVVLSVKMSLPAVNAVVGNARTGVAPLMSHTNPVRISPRSKVPPGVVFVSVIVRVSPEISKRADAETLSPVSALVPEPTKRTGLAGRGSKGHAQRHDPGCD